MKLFQLLVRESELKGVAEKIKSETEKVFRAGDLFNGFTRVYSPKADGGDPLPEERKEVVTTVKDKLSWLWKHLIPYFDYEIRRDKANQVAVADLVVGGKILATAVPASTLLSLEKQLRALRQIYDAIPTLDMAKVWKADEGKWVHGPVDTFRYAKKTVPVVMYEATDRHPAQVKEVTEDVLVGTWRAINTTGAVHPARKAELLHRLDAVIDAVITARMKANEAVVSEDAIGAALNEYIHAEQK